jgi:hypothetical protein
MYKNALDIIWETNSFEASVALLIFEKYVNGVEIQWERIQQDKKALPGSGPGVDLKIMQTLFFDIHFYFVCIDKVQNLLEKIAELDGDPELKTLWDRYKPLFKPFNDVRNILEHIEREITNKENLSDFGNIYNDAYTFGGKKFDISNNGLNLAIDAYKDVCRVISRRKEERMIK